MSKLLSAEFFRLFKSMIFRVCMFLSAGMGVVFVLTRWMDFKRHPEIYEEFGLEAVNADGLIFVGAIYLIFVVASFVAIFIGTEYGDGTMRNKVIVGHTRVSIYLSKFIVCVFANIVFHLLYIAVVLALGEILIYGTTMKVTEIIAFTATGIVAVIALTAILLFFSMSIQNKAVDAVACLMLVVVMLFASVYINQRLEQPEYHEVYNIDYDKGEILDSSIEKNQYYISGTKRQVFEFFNDFIPVSQLFQIVMNDIDNFGILIIYDLVVIFLTSGAGIYIFKKKNLK